MEQLIKAIEEAIAKAHVTAYAKTVNIPFYTWMKVVEQLAKVKWGK